MISTGNSVQTQIQRNNEIICQAQNALFTGSLDLSILSDSILDEQMDNCYVAVIETQTISLQIHVIKVLAKFRNVKEMFFLLLHDCDQLLAMLQSRLKEMESRCHIVMEKSQIACFQHDHEWESSMHRDRELIASYKPIEWDQENSLAKVVSQSESKVILSSDSSRQSLVPQILRNEFQRKSSKILFELESRKRSILEQVQHKFLSTSMGEDFDNLLHE